MLEPGIRGHLHYVAIFPFSHKWPLKTGATVVQMKDHALFQGETITYKIAKIHYPKLKIFLSRNIWPIATKLGTKQP